MPITEESKFYELELELDVVEFKAQYADCGSHKIKLTLKATHGDLEAMLIPFVKEKLVSGGNKKQ